MTRVRGIYRWTDCGYLSGWRVQSYYRDATYRLISPRNRIVYQGTEAACRQELVHLAERERLERPTGRLIVLLHGLARNAWAMSSLARYLRREWPGADVVAYQYASTSAQIDQHARHFIKFMEYADQCSAVDFVAHSLGNIVLRRAFRLAEEGQWRLPRLGSHVMLGPPNQGSLIAARLQNFKPLAWFNGASFMQLGRDWGSFVSDLATPPCRFGIIAGHISLATRFHPLLDGPSDLLVRLEETHLPGESDFLEVNVPHHRLMSSRRVQAATLSFLKSGRFNSHGVPAPVQ
jgi:triacylglycerol lipase